MLPEQRDILWTFLTIMFTLFSLYTFSSVVKHCRERENVSTTFWGGIFGAFLVVMFLEAVHMFSLNQQEQLAFFFGKMVLTIFLLLLTWGVFFKSMQIENQSPPIIRAFSGGLRYLFFLQVIVTGCRSNVLIHPQRLQLL